MPATDTNSVVRNANISRAQRIGKPVNNREKLRELYLAMGRDDYETSEKVHVYISCSECGAIEHDYCPQCNHCSLHCTCELPVINGVRKMNSPKPVNNTEQDEIVERTARVLLCRAYHQTMWDLAAHLSGDPQIDPENCEHGNTAEHRAFYLPVTNRD